MGYDAELSQIAKEQEVPYVDMATVEANRLEALGPEKPAYSSLSTTPTPALRAPNETPNPSSWLSATPTPPLVAYLKPSTP
jgi:rhamnogalacturonan acetylesterase